jgi:hypothetical protein
MYKYKQIIYYLLLTLEEFDFALLFALSISSFSVSLALRSSLQ